MPILLKKTQYVKFNLFDGEPVLEQLQQQGNGIVHFAFNAARYEASDSQPNEPIEFEHELCRNTLPLWLLESVWLFVCWFVSCFFHFHFVHYQTLWQQLLTTANCYCCCNICGISFCIGSCYSIQCFFNFVYNCT